MNEDDGVRKQLGKVLCSEPRNGNWEVTRRAYIDRGTELP